MATEVVDSVSHMSFGNVITIVTVVLGLVIQYIAIVKSFTERITVVETCQKSFKHRMDKVEDGIDKCPHTHAHGFTDELGG